MSEIRIVVLDADRVLDDIKTIKREIRRMGRLMATATQQLTDLTAKVDDLVADFRAFRDAVNTDTFSAEAQVAFDSLSAKIGGLDTEVGDADGSDTPV